MTIAEVERELMKSISKSTDLYYETLLLLTEIQRRAYLKIDAARNKRLASNIDLNPNTRFIDNPVLKTIWDNKKFQSYINNNMVTWNDSQETVLYFYNIYFSISCQEFCKLYFKKEWFCITQHNQKYFKIHRK